MKLLRDVLGLGAIFLLGLGYLRSQWAYFAGEPARWAYAVDHSSVRILAAVLFLGAIVLSFFPVKESS